MNQTYFKSNRSVHANGVQVVKVWAGELFVMNDDHYYQRRERPTHRKRMVNDWDWDACGILKVAPPNDDGKYAILDGQNRWAAIREKYPNFRYDNGKPVMVLVCIHNRIKTLRDEAGLYRKSNSNMTPISKTDDFKAAVCQGERDPLAVAKLLSVRGLTIVYGKRGQGRHGEVRNAAVFLDAYRALGAAKFKGMLDIICNWRTEDTGEVDKLALRADFVKGLALFIGRKRAGLASIRRQLASANIWDIYQEADKLLQKSTDFSYRRAECYADAISEVGLVCC